MTGPAATSRVRGMADVLCLAAAPSFVLLALLTAGGGAPDIMCMHGAVPLGSMSLMYGLMALFHLPPWLRLVGRPLKSSRSLRRIKDAGPAGPAIVNRGSPAPRTGPAP